MNLDAAIRRVPNFPKPGVLFYDITSIFTNPEAFEFAFQEMLRVFGDVEFDGVIAVESRGFLMSSLFALEKKIPMVLARKKGKLPCETIEESYALEYGEATLEVHIDDLPAGKKWLIVDDLIATGGTLEATAKLVERQGSEVAGIFSIIGLPFLGYSEKIGKYNTKVLLEYNSEEV
jgi:adenine phosphoribosyltransferase